MINKNVLHVLFATSLFKTKLFSLPVFCERLGIEIFTKETTSISNSYNHDVTTTKIQLLENDSSSRENRKSRTVVVTCYVNQGASNYLSMSLADLISQLRKLKCGKKSISFFQGITYFIRFSRFFRTTRVSRRNNFSY